MIQKSLLEEVYIPLLAAFILSGYSFDEGSQSNVLSRISNGEHM